MFVLEYESESYTGIVGPFESREEALEWGRVYTAGTVAEYNAAPLRSPDLDPHAAAINRGRRIEADRQAYLRAGGQPS